MSTSVETSLEPKGVPAVPWTPLRTTIHSWIKKYSVSLADLYEAALRLLSDKSFPERATLIAHAIREIQNGLPKVILGEVGKAGRNEPTEHLKRLLANWTESKLPLDESSLEGFSIDGAAPLAIPLPTVRLIVQLLKHHNEPTQKRINAFTKLFERIVPDNRPSPELVQARARLWLDIQEWFVGLCHNDRRGSVKAVDEKEFVEKFEQFEVTLGASLQEFFKTMKDVDGLLAETN